MLLIGVGFAISYFFGRFWNLVVTEAVVSLLGLAGSAGSVDATVFHVLAASPR